MPLSTGHTKQLHPPDQFLNCPGGVFSLPTLPKFFPFLAKKPGTGWDKKDIESSEKI